MDWCKMDTLRLQPATRGGNESQKDRLTDTLYIYSTEE